MNIPIGLSQLIDTVSIFMFLVTIVLTLVLKRKNKPLLQAVNNHFRHNYKRVFMDLLLLIGGIFVIFFNESLYDRFKLAMNSLIIIVGVYNLVSIGMLYNKQKRLK